MARTRSAARGGGPGGGSATLAELANLAVDDVLAELEEPTPDYRSLYYRWESQQWQTGALEFDEDRRTWSSRFGEPQRRALMRAVAPLRAGEDEIRTALARFVDAAPSEEQQVFLTTQLADHARHTVFFDRFAEEVVAGGDGAPPHGEGELNSGWRRLLLERLPAASDKIVPGEIDSLVAGIVLHHLVIESTLRLTGERFLLNYARAQGILPAFRAGLAAVARDQARHVAFALRFLQETLSQDRRRRDVVSAVVGEVLPLATSAIGGRETASDRGDSRRPNEIVAFARSSLSRRLEMLGVGASD